MARTHSTAKRVAIYARVSTDGQTTTNQRHRHPFLVIGYGHTHVREFVLPPSSLFPTARTAGMWIRDRHVFRTRLALLGGTHGEVNYVGELGHVSGVSGYFGISLVRTFGIGNLSRTRHQPSAASIHMVCPR